MGQTWDCNGNEVGTCFFATGGKTLGDSFSGSGQISVNLMGFVHKFMMFYGLSVGLEWE